MSRELSATHTVKSNNRHPRGTQVTLKIPSLSERPTQGPLVDEFELTTQRNARSEPGQHDPERSQTLGQGESRRIALHVCAGAENDLTHSASLNAMDELCDLQIIWPDALQWRQ